MRTLLNIIWLVLSGFWLFLGYIAAGILLPETGRIFLSVASQQAKEMMVGMARRLVALGFELIATAGTARALGAAGIPVEVVKKLQEGHPNLIDHLIDGRVQLIFNTPRGKGARTDEGRIRAASVLYGVPCITTLPAAEACVRAMEALRTESLTVQPIQDRFPEAAATRGWQPVPWKPGWKQVGLPPWALVSWLRCSGSATAAYCAPTGRRPSPGQWCRRVLC